MGHKHRCYASKSSLNTTCALHSAHSKVKNMSSQLNAVFVLGKRHPGNKVKQLGIT